MNFRDRLINLFSRYPVLYSLYESVGLKDFRNGTKHLKSKLDLANGVVSFDSFKMFLDASSYMDLSLYKNYLESGSYEKETSQYIKKNLKPGGSFIDVGANSGYYSLLASNIVGESGVVYSFEPFPQSYNRLKKNIELNMIRNIKIFNIALSSYDGVGVLNVSKSSDGLNSLENISLVSETIKVNVNKLDTLLGEKTVDMIKIDAEGSELDIIKGARAVLTKTRYLKIIYEINRSFYKTEHIMDELNTMGFASFTFNDSGRLEKIEDIGRVSNKISNIVACRINGNEHVRSGLVQ
ncbi:MAG: FkbM family methyltransferase [Candidatus Parvarchaeum sp.]